MCDASYANNTPVILNSSSYDSPLPTRRLLQRRQTHNQGSTPAHFRVRAAAAERRSAAKRGMDRAEEERKGKWMMALAVSGKRPPRPPPPSDAALSEAAAAAAARARRAKRALDMDAVDGVPEAAAALNRMSFSPVKGGRGPSIFVFGGESPVKKREKKRRRRAKSADEAVTAAAGGHGSGRRGRRRRHHFPRRSGGGYDKNALLAEAVLLSEAMFR